MTQALAQGLRLAHHYIDFILSRLWWILTRPALKWLECWQVHRSTILFLALINTSLTTVSEIGSRTVLSTITQKSEVGFFIKTTDGRQKVHRQSLINIVMTLLATLLGGPVHFINTRPRRFFFFISFGVFNSFLSQTLTSFFIEGLLSITSRRLIFDFAYNASIKFLLFEFVRPFLLKYKESALRLAVFRVGQDFFTTTLRVLILNVFKLSGH